MTPHFDFSEVPHSFGLCAAENCPKAATCLRRIAMQYAPVDRIFLPTMNPNRIKAGKNNCNFYCPNEKTRFALGFTRTANALTVRMASVFRYRMIGYFGRKNYYLKRRGTLKITPNEQQKVISVAKELGVVLNDYFDKYIEEYCWNDKL